MAKASRLSPEGRGPFDVAGQRLRIEGGRIWLGAADVTDAIVRHAEFEFSVGSVDASSFSSRQWNVDVAGNPSVVVTIELMLPGEFNVKPYDEDEWTGPVILDQKELL